MSRIIAYIMTVVLFITTGTGHVYGAPKDKLNAASITMIDHFCYQLESLSGFVSCKSTDKNVATVTRKGLIKSKATGTCVIYVTTKSGAELKCNVTVIPNVYTAPHMQFSNQPFGDSYLKIYQAKFDSKDNLIIRADVLNHAGKTLSSFNYKLSCTDNNGVKFTYSGKFSNLKLKTAKHKVVKIVVPKDVYTEYLDIRNAKFILAPTYTYK